MGEEQYRKLEKIENRELLKYVAEFLQLCDPAKVYVSADEPADFHYIRQAAVRSGEETRLAVGGPTLHFDNHGDQGRDKKNTGILVPAGTDLGEGIETKPREAALTDIRGILRGIMKGKEAFVCFFCLGPAGSRFAIPLTIRLALRAAVISSLCRSGL